MLSAHAQQMLIRMLGWLHCWRTLLPSDWVTRKPLGHRDKLFWATRETKPPPLPGIEETHREHMQNNTLYLWQWLPVYDSPFYQGLSTVPTQGRHQEDPRNAGGPDSVPHHKFLSFKIHDYFYLFLLCSEILIEFLKMRWDKIIEFETP